MKKSHEEKSWRENMKIRLIASSQVLEFGSNTRFEKCRVELKFFWKSVESNWEVELEHSSRVEKLDPTIRLENSTRLDKILDRCKELDRTVYMISLHDFLSCFPVMTLYQSQTVFMFSRHVSRHVSLHVSLYVSLYVSRHDFLSNLSIKQSSWFFVMTFYHDFSSWLFFIASLHDSSIMTSLSWLLFMTLYHIVFMFSVMTSIKKIMQKGNAKAKNRENFYI